jgi:hypothetical protein
MDRLAFFFQYEFQSTSVKNLAHLAQSEHALTASHHTDAFLAWPSTSAGSEHSDEFNLQMLVSATFYSHGRVSFIDFLGP